MLRNCRGIPQQGQKPKRKRDANAKTGRSTSLRAYAFSAPGSLSQMPLFAKIATAENSLRPAFANIFDLDAI